MGNAQQVVMRAPGCAHPRKSACACTVPRISQLNHDFPSGSIEPRHAPGITAFRLNDAKTPAPVHEGGVGG